MRVLVTYSLFESGNPNPFAVIFRTEEFCNARVALGVTVSLWNIDMGSLLRVL